MYLLCKSKIVGTLFIFVNFRTEMSIAVLWVTHIFWWIWPQTPQWRFTYILIPHFPNLLLVLVTGLELWNRTMELWKMKSYRKRHSVTSAWQSPKRSINSIELFTTFRLKLGLPLLPILTMRFQSKAVCHLLSFTTRKHAIRRYNNLLKFFVIQE